MRARIQKAGGWGPRGREELTRLGLGRKSLGRWEGINEGVGSLPCTLRRAGNGERNREHGTEEKEQERERLNNCAVHYAHNPLSACASDVVKTETTFK